MSKPWYETYPRKYWTAAERAAALKEGWRPSAAEARSDMYEQQRISQSQHLPVPPMIFGGAVEPPERYEDRQRRRRVDAILKKYDIGQRPGPWWRI